MSEIIKICHIDNEKIKETYNFEGNNLDAGFLDKSFKKISARKPTMKLMNKNVPVFIYT